MPNQINDNNIRKTILQAIKDIRSKFKRTYGSKFVVCYDNKNYWRRQYFPPYKAHRKAQREAIKVDWNAVFQISDQVKAELIENFPYYSLDVEQAEADDVIAVLAMLYARPDDRVLIVSGDKDFGQLHGPFVDQYDPVRNKKIVVSDPKQFLLEHVITGDRGDGIPNVLSGDHCLVTKTRQTKLMQKRKQQIISNVAAFCEENNTNRRNWERNCKLIDLTQIPERVRTNIIEAFVNHRPLPTRENVRKYLIKQKLSTLLTDLNDF